MAPAWKQSESCTPPWDHRLKVNVLYRPDAAIEVDFLGEDFPELCTVCDPGWNNQFSQKQNQFWQKRWNSLHPSEVEGFQKRNDYMQGEEFALQTWCGPALEVFTLAAYQWSKEINPSVISFSPYTLINVAKVLAVQKFWKYLKKTGSLKLYGVTNKRYFTYYASAMNTLRTNAAYASALMAPIHYWQWSDHLQESSASQVQATVDQYFVLEAESHLRDPKSLRKNDFILQQAQQIFDVAKQLWAQWNQVFDQSDAEAKELWKGWVQEDRQYREQLIEQRRIILSGVNDYVASTDHHVYAPKQMSYETFSIRLERLRSATLKSEISQKRQPKLFYIGERGELSARLQFVQHFFALAGIEIVSVNTSEGDWYDLFKSIKKDQWAILCASDATYAGLSWDALKNTECPGQWFVAGELSGIELPAGVQAIHRKTHAFSFWQQQAQNDPQWKKALQEYGL